MAQAKTPIKESSASTKAPVLGLLVLAGAITVFSFWTSASAYSPQNNNPAPDYSNPASRNILSAAIPQKFAAFKNLEGAAANAEASSIMNYFFRETGTAHPWSAYSFNSKVKGFAFDAPALGAWLAKQSTRVNQDARDAELKIENNKAVMFTPDQDGQALDLARSQTAAEQSLLSGKDPAAALVMETHSPKIHLADLNNLGVKTLLARGQSDFSGSSASRIVNIGVGSSQFNGVIIAPGEEFSFNKYLGPITEAKGYLPELVIKKEGVDKELGGGLCQVATTAFRAAFFSGLPITQRRNHSYPVHYYEWISDDVPRAVGLDATIYPGAQDMKFINDTPGSILIWTKMEGRKLYFDFYGTSDGREVAMDGPHPYDKRPDGAVKSTVSRTVTRAGGEAQTSVFKSTYVSPELYPKLYELPKPMINPEAKL